jgi:hypothetical protein
MADLGPTDQRAASIENQTGAKTRMVLPPSRGTWRSRVCPRRAFAPADCGWDSPQLTLLAASKEAQMASAAFDKLDIGFESTGTKSSGWYVKSVQYRSDGEPPHRLTPGTTGI